jgi:hypothetical protein
VSDVRYYRQTNYVLHSSAGLAASVRTLASSALSLLRSLTHDWHFLPGPSQAGAAQAMCSLLAAYTHANLSSSSRSLADTREAYTQQVHPTAPSQPLVASLQVQHSTLRPTPASVPQAESSTAREPQNCSLCPCSQHEEMVCPLSTLLQLDPALLWLQRLASASSSARVLCTTATALHNPCAADIKSSSASASPSSSIIAPDSSPERHGADANLLQLLVLALDARSQLRHQQQQEHQQQHQLKQSQWNSQQQSSQPHPTTSPSISNLPPPSVVPIKPPTCFCGRPSQSTTSAAPQHLAPYPATEQLMPAAACALLMLPAHAWQGMEPANAIHPQLSTPTNSSLTPPVATPIDTASGCAQSAVQHRVACLLVEEAVASVGEESAGHQVRRMRCLV